MASNVDTVKGIYEAFGRGDIPAILGTMDEKIDWKEPPGLAPAFTDQIGPEAVGENVFGQVVKLIKDFSATPEEFIDGGDVVISLGRYRGIGAETGVDLDARNVHIWRFDDDGKLVGFELVTDTHLWRKALGLS